MSLLFAVVLAVVEPGGVGKRPVLAVAAEEFEKSLGNLPEGTLERARGRSEGSSVRRWFIKESHKAEDERTSSKTASRASRAAITLSEFGSAEEATENLRKLITILPVAHLGRTKASPWPECHEWTYSGGLAVVVACAAGHFVVQVNAPGFDEAWGYANHALTATTRLEEGARARGQ